MTSMTTEDFYPPLYDAENSLSNDSQRYFILLILLEILFLFLSSIISMDFFENAIYSAICTFILLLSFGVLIFRTTHPFESEWYNARAQAESIKTSTWRFAMRAHPYDTDDVHAEKEFLEFLADIVRTHKKRNTRTLSADDKHSSITGNATAIRKMPCQERTDIYLRERIKNQGLWYKTKSKLNNKKYRVFVCLSILCYLLAIALSIAKIVIPCNRYLPIDTLVFVAGSLIGWMQTRKYRELATAYGLTQIEIGISGSRIGHVSNDAELSTFVNDTELVFSREHTRWVARKDTAGA